MFIFYNPAGIGDVLIIPLKDGKDKEIKHEKFGDITKITDKEGHVYGYNIFKASTYMTLTDTGRILLTEELLSQIKQIFKKNNLNDVLDIDTTPKFVVGYVERKEQHENADKLSVCHVNVGDETLQIVCGAANVDQNQKVVVAKVGATMPSGLNIKPTKLRGVNSHGMICSREELGLPNKSNEEGIYVLDDSHVVGEPFVF